MEPDHSDLKMRLMEASNTVPNNDLPLTEALAAEALEAIVALEAQVEELKARLLSAHSELASRG